MFDFLSDLFDIFGWCADMSREEKSDYEAQLAREEERVKSLRIERAIAEGKWLCECGYMNIKHISECASCGRYKKLSKTNLTAAENQQNAPSDAADTWLCSKCGSLNENADSCSLCGKPRR